MAITDDGQVTRGMAPKIRVTRTSLSKARKAAKEKEQLIASTTDEPKSAAGVFTSFCEGDTPESIVQIENGDDARNVLNTPVQIEQLREEHSQYTWTEERTFAYDTMVGGAMRRLYMDSRLFWRSLNAVRSAWFAKGQDVASGVRGKPVLSWNDNGALKRKDFKDFIMTMEGRALYQAALADDIAATDVLSIALEWANTLVKPYTWQEAEEKTPANESTDAGYAGDAGSRPQGAVKYISSDKSAIGAMAAWMKMSKWEVADNEEKVTMVAYGEIPDMLAELPPLIPLPRHIGGRYFGVNRTPGIVNPWAHQQERTPEGKEPHWRIESDYSDKAVAEMEAALAEDDQLVRRLIHHGADNSWDYEVDGDCLVDDLASEVGYEAGKAVYFERDFI